MDVHTFFFEELTGDVRWVSILKGRLRPHYNRRMLAFIQLKYSRVSFYDGVTFSNIWL